MEAAVAEAAQQLDEQEWNMNELERIQEEQVCLGTFCHSLGTVSSMHAYRQQLGFTNELRASNTWQLPGILSLLSPGRSVCQGRATLQTAATDGLYIV